MRNLIPYHLFEGTSSIAGTIPKIDVNELSSITGKKVNPEAKGKLDNYMGNWFQNIGNTIERLGGDLIKDPSAWKDKYKSRIPGYDLKTAGGETQHMATDAGFSDIVGLGVGAVKGVLSKMFGGPETAPPIDEANPEITPEHQRIFVDKHRGEISHLDSQDDVNKWAIDKYKSAGFKPGENEGFDKSIQASEMDWLGSSGGESAIKNAGSAVAGEGAGAGLGEFAEAALFL